MGKRGEQAKANAEDAKVRREGENGLGVCRRFPLVF